MSVDKWMAKLQKLSGAVSNEENVHREVLTTDSPSLNFIFGNAWGLPVGFTMALWGPQKGGKSTIVRAFIGKLHREDPEAFAIVYDTEGRWQAQMTPEQYQVWGIDRKRLIIYETNEPKEIFDAIETDLWPMIQDGCKIKLVIIDSVTQIRGVKSLKSDSVANHLIGDHALTIKSGMSRIIKAQRKGKFGLIATCQVSDEMDEWEQKRNGHKWRMNSANSLKHYAEYFVLVQADKTAAGREDLLGNKFEDEEKKDLHGKSEELAHKIRVRMEDSSMGPKKRTAVFTLHNKKGIINTHEEVFLLGVNRGIIEKPTNMSYALNGRKWTGKESMLTALKEEPELQKLVLNKLKEEDLISIMPQKTIVDKQKEANKLLLIPLTEEDVFKESKEE